MIHARQLARTFLTKRGREKTEITAVAGVDIDVEAEEIVGFLDRTALGRRRHCAC